ncbi:MAG: DUF177 domain-containing protein, partial [Bacteroidota bacterium]
ISGLKIGTHSFDFQIDSSFFANFPDSLMQEGQFEVHLDFEKRLNLYEMHFSFSGHTKTACDRCLMELNFPVKGENLMLVKFAEAYLEEVDVLYIPINTEELNVAKFIYEYLSLAVPYIKTYDCESEEERPCDEAMLKRLNQANDKSSDSQGTNPIWDNLKNIKFN